MKIKSKLYFNIGSPSGILAIFFVTVLFVQLYYTVVLYSLWNEDIFDGTETNQDIYTRDQRIVDTVIFTILFVFSVLSHTLCVFKEPGFLPTNYDKLQEG